MAPRVEYPDDSRERHRRTRAQSIIFGIIGALPVLGGIMAVSWHYIVAPIIIASVTSAVADTLDQKIQTAVASIGKPMATLKCSIHAPGFGINFMSGGKEVKST